MNDKAKRIIRKQLASARAAADHLRDAAICARKAKIDFKPEEHEAEASFLDSLAETMEARMNPPKAPVYRLSDYLPKTPTTL